MDLPHKTWFCDRVQTWWILWNIFMSDVSGYPTIWFWVIMVVFQYVNTYVCLVVVRCWCWGRGWWWWWASLLLGQWWWWGWRWWWGVEVVVVGGGGGGGGGGGVEVGGWWGWRWGVEGVGVEVGWVGGGGGGVEGVGGGGGGVGGVEGQLRILHHALYLRFIS